MLLLLLIGALCCCKDTEQHLITLLARTVPCATEWQIRYSYGRL
jgi:hypothetical protein